MKVTLELRSDISCKQTLQGGKIIIEAAARLAHRFTDRQLNTITNLASALAAIADEERARRGPRQLDRAAASPLNIEKYPQ